MSPEREYYIASGPDLAKAIAFMDERKAAFAAMDAIAQEFGGEAVHQGGMIAGLVLESPPAGWVKKGSIEGKAYYFPKRTSKALKAAAAKLHSVQVKSARNFHGLYCNDGGALLPGPGTGMRILYISWEWAGETLLLSVPTGCDFAPDGSTRLKMSEYWEMREAAAARSRKLEAE